MAVATQNINAFDLIFFKKLFEEISLSFVNVNHFHFGNTWEFLQSDSTNRLKHISCLVEYIECSISPESEARLRFNVIFADWVKANENNEDNALHHTLICVLQFISNLKLKYQQSFTVVVNGPARPFTERFEDLLAGHSLDFSLVIPYKKFIC
jgi:hypothetical protein